MNGMKNDDIRTFIHELLSIFLLSAWYALPICISYHASLKLKSKTFFKFLVFRIFFKLSSYDKVFMWGFYYHKTIIFPLFLSSCLLSCIARFNVFFVSFTYKTQTNGRKAELKHDTTDDPLYFYENIQNSILLKMVSYVCCVPSHSIGTHKYFINKVTIRRSCERWM